MNQEDSALVKSNYSKLPKAAKKTKDGTFDRIWKYYHNQKSRIELSKEENSIRERLEKAWLVLCSHRNRKQVAEVLVKIFNISLPQAWRDVTDAMKLFGNPQDDLKEAKRAISETNALRGMERCWKNGDMEGYLKFQQEYNKINDLYTPKEGDSLAKFLKDFTPHQIVITTSPEELQRQAEKIASNAIDIDYEVEE